MKIKSIKTSNLYSSMKWEVGKEAENGKVITEIKETTMKYPDHVVFRFDIYADGEIYKSLISIPVEVEYY